MHLFQRPDSGACSASAGVLVGPHWACCSVAWSSHCVVGTASHETRVCLLEWGRGLLHSRLREGSLASQVSTHLQLKARPLWGVPGSRLDPGHTQAAGLEQLGALWWPGWVLSGHCESKRS